MEDWEAFKLSCQGAEHNEPFKHIKINNVSNFAKPVKVPDDVSDFLSGIYDSPIKVIADQIHTEMDNQVLRAVQNVGITVDKDELVKALQYDRQQYEKGFQDARTKLKPMCKYLTKCMSHPETDRNYYDWCGLYREDCNCQCCYR